MTPVLVASEVSFRLGARALVDRVSLSLAPGRLVALLGPNGAGKSTLTRLLSGELAATSGAIAYDGVPIGQWPGWRLAAKRAVLPQSSDLSFPFAAHEVVRFGVEGMGQGLSRNARDEIVARAMRDADVAHLAGQMFSTLSGGERQRTHFARILCQLEAGRTVADRQVLFLDEPVASLDLKHQFELLGAARKAAREGAAVLAVLHDLNLAAAFADEIAVMHRGTLAAQGDAGEVLTSAMLRRVFEVDLAVNAPPEGGLPFVLPHGAGVLYSGKGVL